VGEPAFTQIILRVLHPHFMFALSALLSGIYFFKFKCEIGGKSMYALRSVLWLMFAIIWAAFPYVGILVARSMLRLMIAIIMTAEIAYNILYIKDAIIGTVKWILKKS